MYINSIDDFLSWQTTAVPVVVAAKRNQQIVIPCASTLVVLRDLVQANTYNPNSVPKSKMELLRQSIIDNGFAFPVVVVYDPDLEKLVVIDGFHRYLISGPDWLGMSHIPVAVLGHDISKRMAATWQFNKARGFHQVDMDADLIRALIQQGMIEEDICTHLGVDLETVHRYKQMTGIAELFKNVIWSMPWEMVEVDDDEIRS